MKNDTRAAIMTALGDLDKARAGLLGTLDRVDRYAIRNGLHRALADLGDAVTQIDKYIEISERNVSVELRAARHAIDKAIIDLDPHSRWFEVWGDSEERR